MLVVEDSAQLCDSIVSALKTEDNEIRAAGTVFEAKASIRLWAPDLVVLDVALPDGDAFDVLDALDSIEPMPIVIAISGHAGPDESFRLAHRGVRYYLSKPARLEELEAAVASALAEPPNLTLHLKAAVGHVPIKILEAQVRETMVAEALARASGNRRHAARLLQISRQLLQHILRR